MSADASTLLRQARLDDPGSVFRAGAAAAREGLEDEALGLLEQAVREHPNDARLWQVLGLAHRKREDMAPAVRAFERAAALAPADALIAHSLARSNLEAGLPATELFQRAHALAPTDASVIQGLAAARFADGAIDRAIAGLDEQLARHPGWIAGHETICRLRWMAGERAHFTRSFDRALTVAPRETAIWTALIGTLLTAERRDAVDRALAAARKAAGQNPGFDALDATVAAEHGETDRADALFAALAPMKHITLAVRYVRHLLRTNRTEQAAALAEGRVDEDGGHLMWPYLSIAWRLLGDPRAEWLEGDPALIGVYDIGDAVGSLDGLAAVLRGLHIAKHQPLDQSVRGGTQTDGPLFARVEPEIRRLRAAIVDAVERYVAQLPAPDARHPLLAPPRTRIRFSGSWSVRLQDTGFHADHVHPAGWISSAFYVALPQAAMGGGTNAGWLTLGASAELMPDLPPFRLIEPKPGRLVLFPSVMWHGTRPFPAGERLTVAFDVAQPG